MQIIGHARASPLTFLSSPLRPSRLLWRSPLLPHIDARCRAS